MGSCETGPHMLHWRLQLAQYLADGPLDNQIRPRHRQSRLVDHHQLMPPVVAHQSRRWIYCQGSSSDDEHIRLPDG